MELIELQNIWRQYDKNLLENTRINKEILRKLLLSKPERRLNWIKIKAGFNLVLPIAAILFILVPKIAFHNEIDFYIGIFLFGMVSIFLYYWSVRYYLLIGKIDIANTITFLKKDIKQLEKYKIKITRLGYILIPFGMLGIFLMAKFPLLSLDSLLPISLIILVMMISIYYNFKYSIYERFKKLNAEIDEIIELEKE